jgi:hypothetical protein
VEEFNNYHGATMEEDQQMEGWNIIQQVRLAP